MNSFSALRKCKIYKDPPTKGIYFNCVKYSEETAKSAARPIFQNGSSKQV